MSVLDEVEREQLRQVEEHEWMHDPELDLEMEMLLAHAGAIYAYGSTLEQEHLEFHAWILQHPDQGAFSVLQLLWPKDWEMHWYKPQGTRKDLIRAAALIVAQVERCDRLTEQGRPIQLSLWPYMVS